MMKVWNYVAVSVCIVALAGAAKKLGFVSDFGITCMGFLGLYAGVWFLASMNEWFSDN